MYEIKSNGTVINSVIDVKFNDSFENKAYLATVKIVDESELSKININNNIEIYEDNELIYNGIIVDYIDDTVIEIKAENDYKDILNFEASGLEFYNEDSGIVLDTLINNEIDSKGLELVTSMDNLTNITSDAPLFELANFQQLKPHQYGDDMVFLGFDTNSSKNSYHCTFDNVNFTGQKLQEIRSRLIINNLPNIFNLYVQYIDNNQNNYIWDIDKIDGVTNLQLNISDARDIEIENSLDSSNTNNINKLRYIIELSGIPVEKIALAIDSVQMLTVDLINRNLSLTTNIPNSSRNITRKFTDTVGEAVNQITNEENKIIKISNGTINIKEYAETNDFTINEDIPIVFKDIKYNRDNVINKVIIQASNNIKISRENKNSQNFYGFTNTVKKRDTSIKTEQEAIEKANAILNKNSFSDTKVILKIPDNYISNNINISTGDSITINYDDIPIGDYVLSDLKRNNNKFAKLIFTIDKIE